MAISPVRGQGLAARPAGHVATGDIESLAELAAAGDRQSFEALCRSLQDDIWRYCYALTGDRELAFEAAQDTFVRAVTAIRRFRGEGPVRVWLLVIARRATADLISRNRRRPDRTTAEDVPEEAVTDGTGRVDLEQLIAALPHQLGQAFVLTQLLGLSYAQAALIADCQVGTIRSGVPLAAAAHRRHAG